MLTNRIHVMPTSNARIHVLPTGVKDVVGFYGSFYSGIKVDPIGFLIQDLMVGMLDKGTKRRNKYEISGILESCGAQLRIYSDGLRIGFFGYALRDDLPEVFTVLREQLEEPLFDASELDKLRTQAIAARKRAETNTRHRAENALNHVIYPRQHPNFVLDNAAEIEALQNFGVDDLKAYHAAHIGASDLSVSAAGDVNPEHFAQLAGQALNWMPENPHQSAIQDALQTRPGRTNTALDDRLNLDVCMGLPLPLTMQHPDYLPLYVGTYILGGNFSARLMSTVRDEQGLTYGIGASLSGITKEYSGLWQTLVTLSQENLERGMNATIEQIQLFAEKGITAAELDEKQTTLTGKYQVELGNSLGMARTMQQNLEDGYPLSWMDDYVTAVKNLTVDEVNEAIFRYVKPERLHVSVAGTLPEAPAA